MSIQRRYQVCVWLLVSATAASAQVPPDTTIELPEATVTADRERTSDAASVNRITTVPLGEDARQRTRSLADLLDTSTGLYVRRYGPSGSATLAFRGTDPSQTEILLDGLRITDPQSGQVDLSLIPVVLLESVEILHGAGVASGTAGGLGGTVKLRTLQARQRGMARLRVGSGSYGKRSIGAMAAGGGGTVSGVVAVGRDEEEGTFPYVNEALQPPEQTTRTGADMKATSVFGKLLLRGSKHRASVAGWINGVDRGLPGPGNADPVPSRQEDRHFRTWLNSSHRFPGFTMSSDWSVQSARLRYVNASTATDDRTETTTLEGRIATAVPLSSRVLLTSGADVLRNGTDATTEHRAGLFAATTAEMPAFILEASLRGETWSAPSGTRRQLVPRAGLNLKRFVVPDLHLKISFGRSWTVPSLIDRYWVPGGNPNLKAERGWSGEAGLLFDRGVVQMEVTGFSTTLSDRIVWIPSLVGAGVQVWRPTNVGEVRSRGFELSSAIRAEIAHNASLNVRVNVSYTRAVDRSDPLAVSFGHQLKYTPRTVVSSTAGVTSGRLELAVSGRLVGRRYVTSDESSFLPAYVVAGARAGYEVRLGSVSATLSAVAENLFNETYSTIRFYPMPPRHFGVGLNLEWRQSE